MKAFLNPVFENNESKKNILMICLKSDRNLYGGNKYLMHMDIVKQIGPVEPNKIWNDRKNLVLNAHNE